MTCQPEHSVHGKSVSEHITTQHRWDHCLAHSNKPIARDANLCVKPTLTELRNASNGVMTLLREAKTVLCNDRHSARTVVLVASDLNHSALIGWQDLQKLRVIPASFPAVAAVARCYSDLKTKTLAAFLDVFSDTLDSRPMCPQKMKIYLKDNCVLRVV